ncbi:hypothetical protein Cpir12675_001955 [Ceratocystis pirilliformis]|uniref:Feruloyl esterase C n=1 Tax=Ceratocystis pirilliformis TaxID=259994 RepID=A0ABR3ZCC2_9PEZI
MRPGNIYRLCWSLAMVAFTMTSVVISAPSDPHVKNNDLEPNLQVGDTNPKGTFNQSKAKLFTSKTMPKKVVNAEEPLSGQALIDSLTATSRSLTTLDDDAALAKLARELIATNGVGASDTVAFPLDLQDSSDAATQNTSTSLTPAPTSLGPPSPDTARLSNSSSPRRGPNLYNNTLSSGLSRRMIASTGCGMEQLAYDNDYATKIKVQGLERFYYVRIPESYNPEHPYRLIFTLHAFRGSAKAVKNGEHGYDAWYGLPDQDLEDSAIYVAPHGFAGMWLNAAGEDAAFLERIMADVESQLCIDQNQRYIHGYSFGAAMTYATACHMGSAFRAVSSWSGAQISKCPSRLPSPVAFYGQHGVRDLILPVVLGRNMRDRYLVQNNCRFKYSRTPEWGSGDHTITEYMCDENHPVVWVEFDGGHTQHPTDDWSGEEWAPRYTWEFFSRFF